MGGGMNRDLVPARTRSQATVHMIGNAHIDPVWLWQWPEGYQEVRATFQSAIDRMKEYPDFVFTCDSSLFFDVGRGDRSASCSSRSASASPKAAGRSSAAGGSSPTATSRAASRSSGRRCTASATCATASASPRRPARTSTRSGTTRSIPQILARSGDRLVRLPASGPEGEAALDRRCSGGSRPTARACSRTGSRTSTARRRTTSTSTSSRRSRSCPPTAASGWSSTASVTTAAGRRWRTSTAIARLNELEAGLPRLELSSLATLLRLASRRTATFRSGRGELQHHSVGCYTSHCGIKRWNRRAENLLQRAEKWSARRRRARRAAVSARGAQSRRGSCSSSTSSTTRSPARRSRPRTTTRATRSGTRRRSRRLAFNRAIQSIARQIEIEPEERDASIVVFNPHPWPLRADVELEYTWLPRRRHVRVDDDGTAVPMQLTRAADDDERGARTARVPASTCRRSATACTASTTGAEELRRDDRRHRHHARERAPSARARPVHREDRAARGQGRRSRPRGGAERRTRWSSRTDPTRGVTACAGTTARRSELECTSVELVEEGPVRAILRVREPPRLDAPARGLRAGRRLAVRRRSRRARLARAAEAAQAALSDIGCDRRGDVRDSVRPPRAARRRRRGAGSVVGRRVGRTRRADGDQRCEVRLRRPRRRHRRQRRAEPGLGVARPARARRGGLVRVHGSRSADLQRPARSARGRLARRRRLAPRGRAEPAAVRACSRRTTTGRCRSARPMRTTAAATVVVTVVKRAEDDDAAVVRAYEAAGRAAKARFRLFERELEADFGAGEIKTFRVPRAPDAPVVETNLLEW